MKFQGVLQLAVTCLSPGIALVLQGSTPGTGGGEAWCECGEFECQGSGTFCADTKAEWFARPDFTCEAEKTCEEHFGSTCEGCGGCSKEESDDWCAESKLWCDKRERVCDLKKQQKTTMKKSHSNCQRGTFSCNGEPGWCDGLEKKCDEISKAQVGRWSCRVEVNKSSGTTDSKFNCKGDEEWCDQYRGKCKAFETSTNTTCDSCDFMFCAQAPYGFSKSCSGDTDWCSEQFSKCDALKQEVTEWECMGGELIHSDGNQNQITEAEEQCGAAKDDDYMKIYCEDGQAQCKGTAEWCDKMQPKNKDCMPTTKFLQRFFQRRGAHALEGTGHLKP